MSSVTRLFLIVALCVALPACSSNMMTRFDPPSLGMIKDGISEDTPISGRRVERDQYSDRSYAQPDYRQSQYNRDFKRSDYQQSGDRYSYNRNSYENNYKTDYQRQQYSQKSYSQKQYADNQYAQDRYSQNRFNNARDGYQPKKITRDYSDRDVYDTKSTPEAREIYDNRFQSRERANQYGQNDQGVQREKLPDIQQRKVTTYRYVPQNAQKEESYIKPQRQQAPRQQSQRQVTRSKETFEHRVSQGDTLYNISKRYNVTTDEIRRENNIDGSGIKLGQRLRIPGVKNDQVSQKSSDTSNGVARLKAGDSYRVKKGDTIYSIARRSGVSPQELADANGLDDVSQVKFGQELVIPGKENRKSPIRVASIDRKAGLSNLDKKSAKAPLPKRKPELSKNKIKSVDTGVRKKLTGSQRFMWPVGGRIVSKFGRQKSGTINDGVNLSVPVGTKVKASESGVVAYAGNELKGYGNLILVRHKNNWVSAYAHNSKLLVKRGDKVSRGQVIAKSGKSGTVNQPQLHFELRKGSKPVNPMKYLAMR